LESVVIVIAVMSVVPVLNGGKLSKWCPGSNWEAYVCVKMDVAARPRSVRRWFGVVVSESVVIVIAVMSVVPVLNGG
jgi:hypothetical protein